MEVVLEPVEVICNSIHTINVANFRHSLLVPRTGFEPITFRLSGVCANRCATSVIKIPSTKFQIPICYLRLEFGAWNLEFYSVAEAGLEPARQNAEAYETSLIPASDIPQSFLIPILQFPNLAKPVP